MIDYIRRDGKVYYSWYLDKYLCKKTCFIKLAEKEALM